MGMVEEIRETAEERKIVKAGEKALIGLGKTFDNWVAVAKALDVGHQVAKRASGDEAGYHYNAAIGAWLKLHPRFAEIGKAERSDCKWLLLNLDKVELWRAGLKSDEERRSYNSPRTIRRYIEGVAHREAFKQPGGEAKPPGRVAQLARRIGELESELHQEQGRTFTVDAMATTSLRLVEAMRRLIRELRRELRNYFATEGAGRRSERMVLMEQDVERGLSDLGLPSIDAPDTDPTYPGGWTDEGGVEIKDKDEGLDDSDLPF
jgi:hypothetical protein